MKIGIIDPHGPVLSRSLPYAAPFALGTLALVAGHWLGPETSAFLFIAAVVLFNVVGLNAFRQRQMRAAELVTGPGFVRIEKAGLRSQTIRAKDIIGGSTARTASGLLLTFQHKHRDQPITLEVKTDAEADEIRHALGIGHGGFGSLAWRTNIDSIQRAGIAGRLVAAIAGLGVMLGIVGPEALLALTIGFTAWAGVLGAIFGVVALFAPDAPPSLYMDRNGLRLGTVRGWFSLPYAAVLGVHEAPNALTFSVPQPYGQVPVERVGALYGGLSPVEREILVAQVTAATGRAHGAGPEKQDVTGRLDMLRRNGEPPSAWFARLDLVGQMLGTGAHSGYRGTPLVAEDLWAILEDPEAEAELRTAAARVLRHATPDARVRIDAAVAATRDDYMTRRLRIATEADAQAAGSELLHLEAEEHSERLRAALPRS